MLFGQSSALHRALRDFYRRNTMLLDADADDKHGAMMFIAGLYHRQLFDAFERNPLSAVLSLAWTVCSTTFYVPREDTTNAELVAVWSPFICLTTTLGSLDKSQGGRALPRLRPFDLSELRLADADYLRRMKERGDTAPEITDLMSQLLNATPFGAYETVAGDAADQLPVGSTWKVGRRAYRYVERAADVSDRERYGFNFARYEAYEALRQSVQAQIRCRFPGYHQRHGLNVDAWLLPTHEREELSGVRPLLWQMQKSALVWMLYHSLAGLVQLNNNENAKDLLACVWSLERHIECGMCLHHWRTMHMPEWTAIEGQTLFLERLSPLFQLDNAIRAKRLELDMALLVTHNRVQESIDPRLKLTDAALYALREDYLNVARAIVFAVETQPPARGPPQHREPFNCPVYRLEELRKDRCTEPWELWSYSLNRSTLHKCDSPGRCFVKTSLLKLEWDRNNCM